MFKKGISHQGESSSSKGRYDKHSKPRVRGNSELDTPQDRSPCRKCGKLHGGKCTRGFNACYSCRKPGYMIKDCQYMRGQEKGKEKVQPNGQSEEFPRRQLFFALKCRGVVEDTSCGVSGAQPNLVFHVYDFMNQYEVNILESSCWLLIYVTYVYI